MSKMNVGASLLLGASFFALFSAGALAGDLKASSTIDSVTVYPTGATVVRTVPVTLPAGATTVILEDLPLELESDSLKVQGAADHGLAIASVESTSAPADESTDPERVRIAGEIEAINDKLAGIDDRLSALDARRRFLEQLIKAAPEGFGKALGQGNGNIDQWNAASSAVSQGLTEVADAERAAHIEQRALNKELEAQQKALASLPEPRDHAAVRVALSADAATTGTLTVSYHIPSARWAPSYDAQLSTGDAGSDPALSIVRRAEVVQASGEDWNGVRLTLSTAQALGGTAAPNLDPYLVQLLDRDTYSESNKDMAAPMPTAPAADALEAQMGGLARGDAPAKPATIIEAAADFGDFRAEYKVPGLVSVDSGKGARSLQIATEKLAPKLTVKAVPMLTETAYLQASFTSPTGAPLLPGKIALFRDGTFVGNGEVEFTNPGKTIDLGFGADERVHVVRATLDHQTGEHGIFSGRKTDARSYKTTVENLHTRPIDITIVDRIPYSENEDVDVKRLDATTEPTVANLDDKRGVLAWTYTYAPGESRDIVNAYEVSWPANQSLVSLD